MTEPVTVKYDLADILTRIEDKLDKQSEEIGNIKVKLTAVEIELKGVNKRLEAVEGTQKNQVWALIILLGGAIVTAGWRVFFTANP
ncbi:MAG: hemolysin XhlA family protein [Crocosphaera sp.]|nr:hypothetical protein [Crocosphaera sp.]MCH2247901.1 hemolysin XhlA family protein [Crocosphaera sp.]